MISAVVDTNILVRGAIASSPHSVSKRIVDAFFGGRFVLLLSSSTLLEIQRVLADEEIRAKHGWSDDEVLNFCRALAVQARVLEPTTQVPASLTRDLTDTKWVALALDGHADYLVTKDRRHLQRLKRVGRTKMVGPGAFLRALQRSTE
jgi:putative PIN family toxin of toxin-antitoxin system